MPAGSSSRSSLSMTGGGAPVSSDDLPVGAPDPLDPAWRLEIETQPTAFDGLTLVSVTATHEDRAGASYTFHQLVRLSDPPEDEVGDEDELVELIERTEEEAAEQGDEP